MLQAGQLFYENPMSDSRTVSSVVCVCILKRDSYDHSKGLYRSSVVLMPLAVHFKIVARAVQIYGLNDASDGRRRGHVGAIGLAAAAVRVMFLFEWWDVLF